MVATETLWLTATLEEYKTLRAETLAAIQNRHAILAYSVAALGALFALGLSELGTEVAVVIYVCVIPLFSVLAFLLWANEFSRTVRVGRYIEALEHRVNAQLSAAGRPNPLGWELSLSTLSSSQTPRLRFYFAVPAFYLGSASASNLLVFVEECGSVPCRTNIALFACTSALVSAFALIVAGTSLRRMRQRFGAHYASRMFIQGTGGKRGQE